MFYGLTRIIDTLAAESPLRPRYIGLYRQMAEALLPLQRANGFWPVSLLDPVPEQVRESSGTAFFVAGLAWGINQGILEQGRFDDAVLRGWNGLVSVVDEDGKLGWVQQVGYAPDEVKAGYTQLYGVGAFLMAASQVLDMGRQCPVIINNPLLPH